MLDASRHPISQAFSVCAKSFHFFTFYLTLEPCVASDSFQRRLNHHLALGFSIGRGPVPAPQLSLALEQKERAAGNCSAAPDSPMPVALDLWCPSITTRHPLDYHFGLSVLVDEIFLPFFSLADFFDAMESPSH